MEISYIASLTSDSLIKKIYAETGVNLGFAVQKFSRLLAHGFIKNGANVQTLTGLPISHTISGKLWWNIPGEVEDGVVYKYIPFVNIPGFRHLFLFVYSFFYTLLWGMHNTKEKTIVCDVLNISVCLGSLFASKLVGLKSVGVVTDMPGLMVSRGSSDNGYVDTVAARVNKSYLSLFSCYVFLTEQMNEVINRKHRPFIVMEGMVDINMAETIPVDSSKVNDKKVVIYAGGLHEQYGLKLLVEAFMLLEGNDKELWLYGDGPFVNQLEGYCKKDKRIIYKGIVPNAQVVEDELSATLLVNPRPTHEEFTKYSFPSKNMEYMVSGTPVLTTRLPGMPEEYHSYVYLFDKETVDGYTQVLHDVLDLPVEKLLGKGVDAKRFVLENKNNVTQAGRVIELVEKL